MRYHEDCACGKSARADVCHDVLRVINGDRFGITHGIPDQFIERIRALREELKAARLAKLPSETAHG